MTRDSFTKTAPTARPLQYELAGLRWLAAATAHGGAPVVQPISTELTHTELTCATPTTTRQDAPAELQLHRVGDGKVTAAAAYDFGARLARTHAAGAPGFGAAPPGWRGDGWMGRARLPLLTIPQPPQNPQLRHPQTSWGEFFATQRILPYLPLARNNGSITRSQAALIERVCARLVAEEFTAPQPRLVSSNGHIAARLHGDLWCGNVLWTRGETVRRNYRDYPELAAEFSPHEHYGVLIDPAAQGGHAETDLATLSVFGQPHLQEIYAGYQAVSPLAAGYQERIGLHTLHILIVHAALFGSGYGDETAFVARRYT